MIQYILTHSVKVFVYIKVRISQYCHTERRQFVISLPVLFCVLFLIVLRSVQLNHKIKGRDVKINNVVIDNLLSIYIDGQMLQKVIPEVFFFLCHILSQILRIARKLWISAGIHRFCTLLTPHPSAGADTNVTRSVMCPLAKRQGEGLLLCTIYRFHRYLRKS